MNNYEAAIKDPSGQPAALSNDPANRRPLPKVFVVCDQRDTAPLNGEDEKVLGRFHRATFSEGFGKWGWWKQVRGGSWLQCYCLP